jgi:hypothetical protein
MRQELVNAENAANQLKPRDAFLLDVAKGQEPDPDRLSSVLQDFVDETDPKKVIDTEALTALLINSRLKRFLSDTQRDQIQQILLRANQTSPSLRVYQTFSESASRTVRRYFDRENAPYSFWTPMNVTNPLIKELLGLKVDDIITETTKELENGYVLTKFNDPHKGYTGIWMSKQGLPYDPSLIKIAFSTGKT